MKKILQTDSSNFEEIISRNFLYIDKTEYIHKLLTAGSYYFLAHPRRFGKSLWLSTLQALFEGKRELFKGLWIDSADYDWQKYPVIFIDFGNIANKTPKIFEQALIDELQSIAKQYAVENVGGVTSGEVFKSLCRKLKDTYNKVVVLVDEYDKPMLDHINNLAVAQENQAILKELFSVFKGLQKEIKYLFVTGVSRFARTSVFSGGNNLRIIAEEDQFDGLLGITQQELDALVPFFEKTITNTQLSTDQLLKQLQLRYNGYHFSKRLLSVYNPFSVFRTLITGELEFYWFASGTPTFLVKYLKQHKWSFDGNIFQELEHVPTTKEDVDGLREISELKFIPILFEAGYLTIKRYDSFTTNYYLGYPNLEVRAAFLNLFANC